VGLEPKISAERLNFSARLTESLALAHGLPPSPTIVAREFNFRFVGKPITVHAARKWLLGEAIPTQDKLRALAAWLDVSVDWLRFGGAVTVGASTVPTLSPTSSSSPLDGLVGMFMTLSHRDRALVRDFIEMLSQKQHASTAQATQKEDAIQP
jgi:transcriptional regulator with XRE-family HTH domain